MFKSQAYVYISKNVKFDTTELRISAYVDLPDGYRLGATVCRDDMKMRSARPYLRDVLADRMVAYYKVKEGRA